MSKRNQELSWVNVNYSDLTGTLKVKHDVLTKARADFKATLEQEARKAKTLEQDETLIVNFKAWGFGMAKTARKAASKASNGSMFASL